MKGGIALSGFKELEKALLALPAELSRQAEQGALRAGMIPVRKLAVAYAPTSNEDNPGLLKKSIGLNVRKIRGRLQNATRYTARVGPRTGFGVSTGIKVARITKGRKIKGMTYGGRKDPVKYAHLVELGTSHSAAKPFLRPAMDAAEPQIITEMAKGYEKGLAKAVDKLRKK